MRLSSSVKCLRLQIWAKVLWCIPTFSSMRMENDLCGPRLTLFFVLSYLLYRPRVSITSWCMWTARRGRRSKWTAPNACSALQIPTQDTAVTTACRNTTTCKLTTSTRPREKQKRERESVSERERERLSPCSAAKPLRHMDTYFKIVEADKATKPSGQRRDPDAE